jgi:hypothetical protein
MSLLRREEVVEERDVVLAAVHERPRMPLFRSPDRTATTR